MERILIVEDSINLSNAIKLYLEKSGYEVVQATDGAEGFVRACKGDIDLIVLDIMLPSLNGWDILEDRNRFQEIPIIVLSAKGEVSDRLKGYDLGADDYLPKPFSIKELVGKIRAILRRAKLSDGQRIDERSDGLSINEPSRLISIQGNALDLTPREYDLLLLISTHPNRVYSREELLERVWGDRDVTDYRTVDTHIKQIRTKLGLNRQWIKTVWGVGYKFDSTD